MDALDNLKETWKNQPEDTQKVSKVDIYRLMHKKSISIVKWIFIIGLLEFVFMTVFNLIMRFNSNYSTVYEDGKVETIIMFAELIQYLIMGYYLYRFYQNYKSISTSENTKTLMSKILKTRRTVRNYIITILAASFVTGVVMLFYQDNVEMLDHQNVDYYYTLIIIFIVILVVFVGFFLFYQLLYGILLRKLNRNYKELAKLESSK